MPSARLLTLGQLALLDGEGRSLVPPGSTKLLGLLAFLAATPGRRSTREHLVDLFWDDTELKHARASLRQSLHRLRQVLGEDYFPGGDDDVILSGRLLCDRDAFLAAVGSGNLDQAIEGYGGEYIPGFVSRGSAGFEHWRDQERERLHGLFAATAEAVAQRSLADGHPQRAVFLANRLLATDALNERAWRLRLRGEQQLGSQVHLTASIAELRRALAASDWEPEVRTLQLLESLERAPAEHLEAPDTPTLVTDLVGRGPLLAMLYDGWRDATRRPGVHLHLTGRAGLGKSRVLEDFAARLRAERARVVRVRALPRQRFVPGAMLSTVVGALVDLPGATGMSAQSARVLLPLHSRVGSRFPDATPLEFTDPDARFLALLGSLDDLVDAVSHEAPCALLLDDAHWWDDQSRRLVEQLLDRLDTRSVLVVTASRPGHGVISTGCTRESVALTPLTREDVVALLLSLGEHPDVAAMERLADGVQRAANGVPLMVLEAIRLGLDRGLLGLNDRQWCLDRLDEFLAILHPGRLLDERLALLSDSQRQLLLVLWFLELTIHEDELSLLETDAGALADLERLGFLQSTHEGWSIAHDAIGEAIEAGATAEAQASAHRSAGRVVRRRGETRALLAQAAVHFLDAESPDDLVATATTWLRHCRQERHDGAPATLLRDLLGPTVDQAVVRDVLRQVPADLRRRPWTARRLAPLGAVAVAVLSIGGWVATHRPPPPDAVLGFLSRDALGAAVESRVPLYQRDWLDERAPLQISRVRKPLWPRASSSDRNELAKHPQRNRWATFTSMPEGSLGGPTELMTYEGTTVVPLAQAPGDDVSPSWSPDGNFLAFSTTRWSPPGSPTFNVGVLRVATGEVRQLTSGSDANQPVQWSPDGTRIAYLLKSADSSPDSLCWISIDGISRGCRGFGTSQISSFPGWLDGDRVLVALDDGASQRLVSAHVDNKGDRVLDIAITRWQHVRLSPDGRWCVIENTRPQGLNAGPTMRLFHLSDPSRGRSIQLPVSIGAAQLFWRDMPVRPSLARVAIRHLVADLVVNVPSRPILHGYDETGAEVAIPAAVIRWSSSDTTVATVDGSGTVIAHRVGRVTITGSAGGWRMASREFVAQDAWSQLAWEERWDQPWPARWTAWGAPEPVLIPRGTRGWAMLPNGDTQYSSGLFSTRGVDARRGMAMDVVLETPITHSKWQFLDLALRLPGPMAVAGPTGDGCSLRYPAGETGQSRLVMDGLPIDSTIYSGRPFLLRVQLFPDGSCGLAINGRAFKHDLESHVVPATMHVGLGGETVGSQLLIGRVQVWAGVPGDVDWAGVKQ